jgi:hypothetical protein
MVAIPILVEQVFLSLSLNKRIYTLSNGEIKKAASDLVSNSGF